LSAYPWHVSGQRGSRRRGGRGRWHRSGCRHGRCAWNQLEYGAAPVAPPSLVVPNRSPLESSITLPGASPSVPSKLARVVTFVEPALSRKCCRRRRHQLLRSFQTGRRTSPAVRPESLIFDSAVVGLEAGEGGNGRAAVQDFEDRIDVATGIAGIVRSKQIAFGVDGDVGEGVAALDGRLARVVIDVLPCAIS